MPQLDSAITQSRRRVEIVLLVALATVTFTKLQWSTGGFDLALSDLATAALLVVLVQWCRRERPKRLPTIVLGMAGVAALLLVSHLLSYFGISFGAGSQQFWKGEFKHVMHWLLALGTAWYVIARGRDVALRCTAALVGGVVVSGAYGLLQLALQVATGLDLDRILVRPLTFGLAPSGLNIYGAVGDATVYRANGLSIDPNHLGVALVLPILVLTSLIVARTTMRSRPVLAALAVSLLAQLATLSRSGMLGTLVGAIVLALMWRGRLFNRSTLGIAAGVAAAGVLVIAANPSFVRQVAESRLQTDDSSAQVHRALWAEAATVFAERPLVGIGVNNFAPYYEYRSGRSDVTTHSFVVTTITETGIIGVGVTLLALGLFARALLRAAAGSGQIQALGIGLLAAAVATAVSNLFYLTMTMYSFYALVGVAVGLAGLSRDERDPRGLQAAG